MKRSILIIVTIAWILSEGQLVFSQSKKEFARAKKEYNALNYSTAIPLLERAAYAMPDSMDIIEMLADSYRKTRNYSKAMDWYTRLCSRQTIKPTWALTYAEVLANNQKFDEAEKWYLNYLRSDTSAKMASPYMPAESFMEHKKNWRINYTNLNTNASDYAPVFYKDGLVFVSNRHTNNISKRTYGWDQMPFSDLYFVDDLMKIRPVNIDSVMKTAHNFKPSSKYRSNDDDTRATSNDNKTFVDNQALFNDTLAQLIGAKELARPLDRLVNTKYHEGPMALLPDGSLIFTRNNYYKGRADHSKEGINKLKLFTAVAPGLKEIRPFPYNSNEYSTGHPAVNKAGTLLIFASDMPGGKGGTDLYYSTRTSINYEWSTPVNLGNIINTEGNELFPTLDADSVLFFSSTGHPGLGGLDIFQVRLNGINVEGKPVNLGAPVNSSVDDFSLVRHKNGRSGFFTSNRRGNDDIYGFENMVPPIIQDNTRSTTAEISKQPPQPAGIHFKITRQNYQPFNSKIAAPGVEVDSMITISNEMISCKSIKRLFAGLSIYYNRNEDSIRSFAMPALDSVAAFLKMNPDFSIIASSHCDSRASNSYNIYLSLRRSRAVQKYLEDAGIEKNRIEVLFWGEEQPFNKCKDHVECTESEMQQNRRTDILLLYKNKRLADLHCDELN